MLSVKLDVAVYTSTLYNRCFRYNNVEQLAKRKVRASLSCLPFDLPHEFLAKYELRLCRIWLASYRHSSLIRRWVSWRSVSAGHLA